MESQSLQQQRAAFERLIDLHGAGLKRLCRAYLLDLSDQQDLLQEILMAVWGALPRFRAEASERTWLYRIAHNVALTFSGRRRRQHRAEEPFDETLEPVFTRSDPKRLELLQAIQRLDTIDRQIACLYLEGFSAKEIEDVSGLTANAIAVRLNRLRERLRRQFATSSEKASIE